MSVSVTIREALRSSRTRDIYRVHTRPCTRVSGERSSVGRMVSQLELEQERRGKRITVLLCSREMTRTECSNFAQYRRNTGRFGNVDQHFPSSPLFLSSPSLCLSPSPIFGRVQARYHLDSLLLRNITCRNNPTITHSIILLTLPKFPRSRNV